MRKLFISLLSCLFLTNLAPLAAESIGGVEYSIKEDGRKWKVGRELKEDNSIVLAYVLDNETIDNWSESFATSFTNIPAEAFGSPESFNQFFPSLMKAFYPDKEIDYKIINITPKNILAEWWMQGQSPDNQHGWIRLLQTGKGIVALQYTTKKADQVETARKIWLPILQGAKVTQ